MVDESGVMSKKEIQGRLNPNPAVSQNVASQKTNQKTIDKTTPNKTTNSPNSANTNKIPNNNSKQNNPAVKKEINAPVEKLEYKDIDKFNLAKWMEDNIPPQVVPTMKTGYALGGIVILVLLIALIKFPFGQMMNPDPDNLDINISIGEPWTFFELQLYDPMANPIRVGGLIGGFILYLFIAYLIDILINVIVGTPLLESEDEKKRHPKFYRNKIIEESKDPSEKLTRKMFESKEKFNNPSNTQVNNQGLNNKPINQKVVPQNKGASNIQSQKNTALIETKNNQVSNIQSQKTQNLKENKNIQGQK